jgi:cell division protein FtsX
MNCNLSGASALFFLIPFFIGAFLCGISGITFGVYLCLRVCDWFIEQLLKRYYVYGDVVKFSVANSIRRNNAKKTS